MKTLLVVLGTLLLSTALAQRPGLDSLRLRAAALQRLPTTPARDSLLTATWLATLSSLKYEENVLRKSLADSLGVYADRRGWRRLQGYHLLYTGQYEFMSGNALAALSYYQQAGQVLERSGDRRGATRAYGSLGSLMNYILPDDGSPADSLILQQLHTYLSKAFRLAEETGDPKLIIHNLANLSFFYFLTGQYATAQRLYTRGEQYAARHNQPFYEAMAQGGRGLCYFFTGDETRGWAYANRMLDGSKRLNDLYLPHVEYRFIANYFRRSGRYEAAVRYARLSLDYARRVNMPEMIYRAEQELYEALRGQGEVSDALYYLESTKRYEDSLAHERVKQRYTELQITYNSQRQQARIQSLQNEALHQATARQTETRNFLILTLGLSAILVGYVAYSNRRLRSSNDTLRRKNEEIREALLKGQTIERKRVASELHDNLSTKVSVLKWRLESLDTRQMRPAEQQLHADLLRTMGDVYEDIRLISHNLLPPELETHGLPAALRKLVGQLNQGTGTRFELSFGPFEGRLPRQQEYELYVIALELINNVLKHAGASVVTIELSRIGEHLILDVQDDGCGLPPDSELPTEGMGLQNIKARLDSLGGRWTVSSREGEGMRARIAVPAWEATPGDYA